MNISILYSGGLDSFIMKRYAEVKYPHANVKCIYFKHGAESEEKEIALLPEYVEVRSIDWLGDKIKPVAKKEDPFAGAIYIPGRNLVFSVLAACQDLPDEIWLGALADENNEKATDKNETFANGTSELLSYVLSPFKESVRVKFPFVEENWTKVDSVKWAIENGASVNDLLDTVSCWHYNKKPCGKCKQCFKRHLVFATNNIDDGLEYDVEEFNTFIKGYIDVVSNGSLNADEVNVVNMMVSCYQKGITFKDSQFSSLVGSFIDAS